MKANITPANVSNLLTAAAYVRNETIINGNQAAQLDAMVNQIKDLAAKIEAVPAKIADLAAQSKKKAVATWERMAARYKAQFADAVATLRDWLVDFKANRPNVQIDLDEPEEPETPNPDNTPTTMNTNETNARRAEFPNDTTEIVSTGSTEYANETTVTVSITDNGYKCEYTADGKVIASITYRKEFDAYDVNTPSVGCITVDVTEAHKACESGITWLLEQSGRKAAFDYTAVEEYNAAIA